MDTKKHAIIIDLLSVLTLGIPGIHFFLFKYLFVRKTIFTYGSLKALHAEDGWRGFMIIEDIEPYMLCFFIISAIICLIVSYFVFRNHEGKSIAGHCIVADCSNNNNAISSIYNRTRMGSRIS